MSQKPFMQEFNDYAYSVEYGLSRHAVRMTRPARFVLFLAFASELFWSKLFHFVNFMCGGHDGKEQRDA